MGEYEPKRKISTFKKGPIEEWWESVNDPENERRWRESLAEKYGPKEPAPAMDYSKLQSRPDELNYTPASSESIPKADPMLDVLNPAKLESPEARQLAESKETPINPGKLESPEARQLLKESFIKRGLLTDDARDEQRLLRDDEAVARTQGYADDQKFRAGMGMGIQQIIAGLAGTKAPDEYSKIQLTGADKMVDDVSKRRNAVRDYLLNKDKYKKELAELKSTNDYRNRDLALKEKELSGKMALDSSKRMTPMGVAATDDDAKKAKDAAASYDLYTKKLDRLRALREKHGGELYGPIKAEMDSLSASALVDFKKAAELGALSGSDMGIVEDALGNVSSHMSRTDSALAKLDTARKNADEQIKSFAGSYGLDASKVLKPSAQAVKEQEALQRKKRIEQLLSKAKGS